MFKLIFFFALTISQFAFGYMDGDGIIRNQDGSLKFMNYHEAMRACPEGMHLPTAREWALYGVKHGAYGIRAGVKMGEIPPSGHSWIRTTEEEFYYNNDGFKHPLGKNAPDDEFWSSSKADASYANRPNQIYIIRDILAFLGYADTTATNIGVRCFHGPAPKAPKFSKNPTAKEVIDLPEVTALSCLAPKDDGHVYVLVSKRPYNSSFNLQLSVYPAKNVKGNTAEVSINDPILERASVGFCEKESGKFYCLKRDAENEKREILELRLKRNQILINLEDRTVVVTENGRPWVLKCLQ